MEEKKGLEPAYPIVGENAGMSKRLLLAGMAMQGIMTNIDINDKVHYSEIAKMSMRMTDELLKLENL